VSLIGLANENLNKLANFVQDRKIAAAMAPVIVT
jgi:hypothetical protein